MTNPSVADIGGQDVVVAYDDVTTEYDALRGTKGAKLAKKGPKVETMGLPWRAADALAAIR